MLPWWSVRDALLQKAQTMPGQITIHLGVELDAVTETPEDKILATFQDSNDLKIEADLLIGADGVHSYVRCHILDLPPAVPTHTFVWRGSVDSNACESLQKFQNYPIGTILPFGKVVQFAIFNFHPKVDGGLAWVCSIRDNVSDSVQLQSGTTTPLELIQSHIESVNKPDQKLLQDYQDVKMILQNTRDPSELTWSTEMAVVDLMQDDGWGGKGRITLIGDAAHSMRPASGLGGSLAFEDAALLSRKLATPGNNNINSRLRAFEAQRLPRCQSLSRDQTIRSNLSYTLGFGYVPKWDPEYRTWIMEGPDAAPDPPVNERGVFGSLIEEQI